MTVRSSPAFAPVELLLEAGHEPARAELDHLVAALAAGERLAVERAEVVHDDEVALAGRGARRSRAGRSARAAARPRPRPPRRRPPASRLPTSRPLYSPSAARRAHADLDREGQRLAVAGQLAQVELGLADRHDRRGVDRGGVPGADRVAHRLVEHGLAADALDHDRRGRLAGAEAGHAQVAAERPRGLRDALLDLLGGTSASTRTRDSGSSVTDVVTVGAAMGGRHDTVAAVRTRLAAWLVTGPLGHLAAGDWPSCSPATR